MSERKKSLIASLMSGFVLTLLFPFLFGSQIYDNQIWHLLAPSSLLLGRVTTLERSITVFMDTLVFGAIIFGVWQGVRWAMHRFEMRQSCSFGIP